MFGAEKIKERKKKIISKKIWREKKFKINKLFLHINLNYIYFF